MLYTVAFSKKQLPVSIVVHKMKQKMYLDKIDITNRPWMKNVGMSILRGNLTCLREMFCSSTTTFHSLPSVCI